MFREVGQITQPVWIGLHIIEFAIEDGFPLIVGEPLDIAVRVPTGGVAPDFAPGILALAEGGFFPRSLGVGEKGSFAFFLG